MTNRNFSGSTTAQMAFASNLCTGDATEIKTDSLLARSARADAVNHRMCAHYLAWSVLAVEFSASGTTMLAATVATSLTTADAKAILIASTTLKSAKIVVKETDLLHPVPQKLLMCHILDSQIVKMTVKGNVIGNAIGTTNVNESENDPAILLTEVRKIF